MRGVLFLLKLTNLCHNVQFWKKKNANLDQSVFVFSFFFITIINQNPFGKLHCNFFILLQKLENLIIFACNSEATRILVAEFASRHVLY